MAVTKRDSHDPTTTGVVIPLALSRVHPSYRGLTEGQVRAAVRSVVSELSLDAVAELTWALDEEPYARSAASR